MVWYGMVWYSIVWYGMVWYGMVWYGMVWYGMVQRSHNLGKFPQIFAVFMGVVLGIMRILCNPFKILLFG